MACFLPIGWFLTQTKSLSGLLILMNTFLLGNKEFGRPGLRCVLTAASPAQTAAGKPIPSFVPFIVFFPSLPAELVPTPLSCRGQINWCMAAAFPNPFAFPVPSYHVSSCPIPFHTGGFINSCQPCRYKWWCFLHTRLEISLFPRPAVLFIS